MRTATEPAATRKKRSDREACSKTVLTKTKQGVLTPVFRSRRDSS